ncbi:MAG: pyridoxal phosphate-dependent aminotransferase [Leptospirales bacterium]
MKNTLARRLNRIEPSATMQITAIAAQLKAEGKDIVGFGAGEPDFDTPANIKEAAKKALDEGKTKYTSVAGVLEFRKAIADKLKKENSLDYKPSQIIVSCGGKQALYNVIMALVNPEDEVIIPGPYWVSYRDIVLLAEGEPTILPTTIDKNFKISPEQLESSITKKTKAIILNSPSNPTGTVYSADELREFAEILKKHPQVWIITDDIYEKILYDGSSFVNIVMAAPELKERTVVINGLSKGYAMTGWRLGYAATDNPELLKAIAKIQGQSTSHATTFAQYGGMEALTGDQSAVSEMLEAFTKRRDYMHKRINEMNGLQAIKPGGAFYIFPDIQELSQKESFIQLQKKYNEKSLSKTLAKVLLEDYMVAVVPGIAFGADNGIRLSYATSMELIEKGLNRMEEFFSSLK